MRVENFEHLKQLARSENDDMIHFYIILAGGLSRSSKRMKYDKASDTFHIIHEIDESYQEVSAQELSENTFFKQAISNHCLFLSSIN